MKLSLNKIIYFLILLQIISTQGILTFNVFKLLGNWEIKSLLHPLSIILLIFFVIVYRIKKNSIKLTPIDVFLFLYFFLSFIILLINTKVDLLSAYFSFREVFLIVILIFIYQQITLKKLYWNKLLNLLHILVIANIIFVCLTYFLGPEKYMELLTGRFIWPTDHEYKFKISNFFYFWRSPGLIGSAGNVGYFGLISYFLFDQDEKYKTKKIFAILLAILGFVRSVYLVLIIYWVIKFLLTKRILKKMQYVLPYVLPFTPIVIYILYDKGILDLRSLFMRIDHWIEDMPHDFNLLFGGSIGKVGAAVRGEGFHATLDSYWLLMLISVGLVGIFLLLLFVYEKAKGNNKLMYALLGFLVAGLFITFTQGIVFLVLFPLLFIKHSKLETD